MYRLGNSDLKFGVGIVGLDEINRFCQLNDNAITHDLTQLDTPHTKKKPILFWPFSWSGAFCSVHGSCTKCLVHVPKFAKNKFSRDRGS